MVVDRKVFLIELIIFLMKMKKDGKKKKGNGNMSGMFFPCEGV